MVPIVSRRRKIGQSTTRHEGRKAATVDPGVAAVERVGESAQALSVAVEAARVVVARHDVVAEGLDCRLTLDGPRPVRCGWIETGIVDEAVSTSTVVMVARLWVVWLGAIP